MSAVYHHGMTRDAAALPPIDGVDGRARVDSLTCESTNRSTTGGREALHTPEKEP